MTINRRRLEIPNPLLYNPFKKNKANLNWKDISRKKSVVKSCKSDNGKPVKAAKSDTKSPKQQVSKNQAWMGLQAKPPSTTKSAKKKTRKKPEERKKGKPRKNQNLFSL